MESKGKLEAINVAPSSIVSSASAAELGELFEYRIGQPVTIRKSESAMLPFLQQEIDSRKLPGKVGAVAELSGERDEHRAIFVLGRRTGRLSIG